MIEQARIEPHEMWRFGAEDLSPHRSTSGLIPSSSRKGSKDLMPGYILPRYSLMIVLSISTSH